jgi:hypothetical protein
MRQDTDYLQYLLYRLSSRDEEAREEAVHEALSLPTETRLRLADIGLRCAKRQSGRYRLVARIALTISVILGALVWAEYGPDPLAALPLILLTLSICLSLGFSRLRPRSSDERLRAGLGQIMRSSQDPRFIGPLLSHLDDMILSAVQGRRPFRPTHEDDIGYGDALKMMLSSLRPEHELSLTSSQIRLLLAMLDVPYRDPEMTRLSLKALAHVRAVDAIPAVRGLAARRSDAPDRQSVHEAARQCWDTLNAHVAQMRQADTLLRASDASPAAPQTLLRPAAPDAAGSSSEPLLRPVSSGDGDAV